MGLPGGGAAPRLVEGKWRDGSYAEYRNFQLRMCSLLMENYFLGDLDTRSKVYKAKSYDF
jgi:hypothetical protein